MPLSLSPENETNFFIASEAELATENVCPLWQQSLAIEWIYWLSCQRGNIIFKREIVFPSPTDKK